MSSKLYITVALLIDFRSKHMAYWLILIQNICSFWLSWDSAGFGFMSPFEAIQTWSH
jgi:hypothetical protein